MDVSELLSRHLGLVLLRRGAREDESIDSSGGPGGEMGKRGRLKIAWLRPCRFESCSGHHPESWIALERTQSVQLIQHSRSNVIGREQVLERIAIEQRRSLVALVGAFDLDPIDFLRTVEDPADS